MVDFLNQMRAPVQEIWVHVSYGAQCAVIVLLFLVAGLVVSRAVRTVIDAVLAKIRLDEYTGRVGLNEVLTRLGLGKSPSYLVAFVVYWSLLFVFLLCAANAAHLGGVSGLLERFLAFLPKLIMAIIIAFAGLAFGKLLSRVVENAADANNLAGGVILAQATYGVVLVFAGIQALEQLGFNPDLLSNSIQIILASAGLACALAVGLGAKPIAEDIIRKLFKEKR